LINLDAAGKGKEPAAREMDTLGSAQRGVTGGSEMYPIGQIDLYESAGNEEVPTPKNAWTHRSSAGKWQLIRRQLLSPIQHAGWCVRDLIS
jgi:hypothetical protein